MGHTPGPWEVHRYSHVSGQLWLGIGHMGRGPITELNGETLPGKPPFWSPVSQMTHLIAPDEEQEANARLIAAAPDLLAACEEVRSWIVGYAELAAVVALLDAVTAKAKGT